MSYVRGIRFIEMLNHLLYGVQQVSAQWVLRLFLVRRHSGRIHGHAIKKVWQAPLPLEGLPQRVFDVGDRVGDSPFDVLHTKPELLQQRMDPHQY